MFSPEAKQILIDHYRKLLLEHKEGPMVANYKTHDSQFMRLEQLTKIGNLTGASVLEVGCGIGDFYGLLSQKFTNLVYTGIDIVPELIATANSRFPAGNFECRDILLNPFEIKFDYVLISGVFNNAIPNATGFLKSLTQTSFESATVALGFNFISTYVNYTEEELSYHDPVEILHYCINTLSRKTTMFHHYERGDVCVFVLH